MTYTIFEQVKIRLRQFHMEKNNIVFDEEEEDPILEQMINQAEEDVKRNRNYQDFYSEEMVNKDMKKFESIVVDLVLYDYQKIGGEFQKSYSENGFSGSWISRDEILGKVTPFVQIL